MSKIAIKSEKLISFGGTKHIFFNKIENKYPTKFMPSILSSNP